jgi:hypothetical protein
LRFYQQFSSLIVPKAEAKPWRPKYDDREVEIVVTEWVITGDTGICQKGTENIL